MYFLIAIFAGVIGFWIGIIFQDARMEFMRMELEMYENAAESHCSYFTIPLQEKITTLANICNQQKETIQQQGEEIRKHLFDIDNQ